MKKKILVINAHPYDGSYVSHLFHIFLNNLNDKALDVKIIDLGKMSFDPVLRYGYVRKMNADKDITVSQELLKWANHIVFFYPIWWTSMPGILKGWIDRVLTPGFAYNMKRLGTIKHLKGKTAQLILTCDSPAFYQRCIPNSPIRLMRKHILGLCGIKVIKSNVLGRTSWPGKMNARKNFIDKVARLAYKIGN